MNAIGHIGRARFLAQTVCAGAADGLAFDLGVQGYAGVREGMTGGKGLFLVFSMPDAPALRNRDSQSR